MARLLILDFDGVCTLSSAELAAQSRGNSELALALTEIARPGAVEVVRYAQALGVATMVLSNAIDPSWAEQVEVLGLVDHVINCADNRIFKPDRRAFQRCLLLAEVDPEQAIVVDDRLDNVTVARSLGMKAVFFDVAQPDAGWAEVMTLVGGTDSA